MTDRQYIVQQSTTRTLAVEKLTDVLDALHEQTEQSPIERVVESTFLQGEELQQRDMCFYKVEQLSYDEEYPHREAFENVVLSLGDPSFNFVYVLTGTQTGVELHVGVVRNTQDEKGMSAVNYGEIVAKLFEGNFNGSILRKVQGQDLREKMHESVREYTDAGLIMGIPSVQGGAPNAQDDFQGIDRLVNSMLGQEWRLVVVCEPVPRAEIRGLQEKAYDIYDRLALIAKQTMQTSVNSGSTQSEATTKSDTHGTSKGANWSESGSETSETGYNKSGTKQTQKGEHEDQSSSFTEGSSHTEGRTDGTSQSMTVEVANKQVQELLRYIDEELLQRLGSGFSRGLFKTSVYYMAKGPKEARQLKNGVISLFQGSQTTRSPLRARSLALDMAHLSNRQLLRTYQNWSVPDRQEVRDALTLMCVPFDEEIVGLSTYLTPEEVSLLAGLPQKEVPGLPLKEAVSFGLNVHGIDTNDVIELGQIVERGRELQGCRFALARKDLPKHVFVAGVTGSGKTTTCQKLLKEADTPFWVIEPAKTEYRAMLKDRDDVVVFTLGNETVAPFRINPFELVEGEVISSHIDIIKATFTSAFPMEASMPQLLEEAICQCYEHLGWDVSEVYRKEERVDRRFPTLADVLGEMRSVVETKGFSERLKGDYEGSLVSRLSNLTKGVKGRMLNCDSSTDFEDMIKRNVNVILELEELRSSEDKALFMGFILARLSAVIRHQHRQSQSFRHITLVEEAHRLLAKADFMDSGAKRTAVETFSDMLAEIRKYGEALIIVDQIPNKLAPDVLKNTNTKIVHRLLARDDKETVGDTMSMNAKQKDYLSLLPVGSAVVFTEQTDAPVQINVRADLSGAGQEVQDAEVAERFKQLKMHLGATNLESAVEALLPDYKKVSTTLMRMKVDDTACKTLREGVGVLSSEYGLAQEDVWRHLIERSGRKHGKNAANWMHQAERIDRLIAFFSQTFSNPSFSDADLPGDNTSESRRFYASLMD